MKKKPAPPRCRREHGPCLLRHWEPCREKHLTDIPSNALMPFVYRMVDNTVYLEPARIVELLAAAGLVNLAANLALEVAKSQSREDQKRLNPPKP